MNWCSEFFDILIALSMFTERLRSLDVIQDTPLPYPRRRLSRQGVRCRLRHQEMWPNILESTK